MARLEQFGCNTCGNPLGWTAPGEARRMNSRAHLFCDRCKDKPADLTPRQQDFLTVLREMVSRGEKPSISAAALTLGISPSRAQQIKDAIKLRGNSEIHMLLDGAVPLSEPLPVPPRYTEAEPEPAESYRQPEFVPARAASTPDSTPDPASFGGEFL